jgi:hypothetical protein
VDFSAKSRQRSYISKEKGHNVARCEIVPPSFQITNRFDIFRSVTFVIYLDA